MWRGIEDVAVKDGSADASDVGAPDVAHDIGPEGIVNGHRGDHGAVATNVGEVPFELHFLSTDGNASEDGHGSWI